jgi:hypothetical protein
LNTGARSIHDMMVLRVHIGTSRISFVVATTSSPEAKILNIA